MSGSDGAPDVIVVGSGAAGMMAAAAAALAPTGPATLLLTDGATGRSNTVMAQGGIQVPFGDASAASMLRDMQRSARVPIDLARAERFIANIAPTIETLERWGLELDRDRNGKWERRLAGGLSEPRIVSVRDQIGPALMRALKNGVESAGVDTRSHARVTGIRQERDGVALDVTIAGEPGEMQGRAVVICTGGTVHAAAEASRQRSTNPANRNLDMSEIIRDLSLPEVGAEDFQYQPFGLVSIPGSPGHCVPESIVNFPVRLLDRHGVDIGGIGEDRLDLTRRMFATADRGDAVATELGPGLWLTLDDVPHGQLADGMPKLHRLLDRHSMTGDRVLVFPLLHYQLGGFVTGPDGSTQMPGLFLAGEMVGGIHGKNRLMGNGITDSLVHGRLAGAAAAGHAAG